MKKNYCIKVFGKVQGVAFRYHTRENAQILGISGFVKNLPDSSVYIEAEGTEPNIQQFIDWCKHGPTWARVDKIQINEEPIQNFKGFDVR